jgi:hypothetical protein
MRRANSALLIDNASLHKSYDVLYRWVRKNTVSCLLRALQPAVELLGETKQHGVFKGEKNAPSTDSIGIQCEHMGSYREDNPRY